MAAELTGRGITIFDSDSRGGDATVVLSADTGTFDVTVGDSGVTIVSGDGTGSVTLRGTIIELDNLFRGETTGTIVYTCTAPGPVVFTLTVTDEDGLTSTITFNGLSSDLEPPVVSVPGGGNLIADVGVALQLEGAGFNVSDPDDNGEFATLEIEATASGVPQGAINASPGNSGATVVSGNGTPTITLTGTISALSAFLTSPGNSTWSYTPSAIGTKVLTLTVTDSQQQVGSNTKSVTVASPPVVDAPDAFISATTSVDENIEGRGFSYTDVDATGTQFAAIFVDAGTLNVTAGNSGVSNIAGNGTATVTLEGTITQINNLLQGIDTGVGVAGTIIFNHSVATTVTLTVQIEDDSSRTGDNFATIVLTADNTWLGYGEATPLATSTTIAGFVLPIDLSLMPQDWWDRVSLDGRDIRVTNNVNAVQPRHVFVFDKVAQTGMVFTSITNGPSPTPVRIWVGATSADEPGPTDTNGSEAVYANFIRGWWPNGGGNDATAYDNHMEAQEAAVFGDSVGPFSAPATNYGAGSGSSYAQTTATAGIAAAIPETFCAFVYPARRTNEAVMCSQRGEGTNLLTIASNKVVAGSVDDDGVPTFSEAAIAIGDVSTGVWQFVAGSFLTTSSRIAYRSGGNPGTDDGLITETGVSPLRYVIGAYKTPSFTTARFEGVISLAFILAAPFDAAKIPAWLANYNVLLSPNTYWGTWLFQETDMTGLEG